jgi:hypothetical protein
VLENGEMNTKHRCRAQSNTILLPTPLKIQKKNYPTTLHSVSNAMGTAFQVWDQKINVHPALALHQFVSCPLTSMALANVHHFLIFTLSFSV